jgi:hypothetical protein
MPRIVQIHMLLALTAIGCVSRVSDVTDSTAVDEHGPSLHAQHASTSQAATDSAFRALQSRGAAGMGVDQYTSTHTFEPLPTGGRITLRRDVDDSTGVEQIRAHLREIAASFAAGVFTTPAFVHDGAVPGTDVMAARRGVIHYGAASIPRGAELVMTTSDSVAIDAIHRFLAFQRREHRAGGAP